MEQKATVDFIEYDKNWIVMFENEKKRLNNIFRDNVINIEHFGSTSIQGMSGKGIIYIFVFVYDLEKINQYNSVMENLGYTVKGREPTGCIVFVKHKNNSNKRTHKINICKNNNAFSIKALLFRDYLRINRQACNVYENLKKELSQKYHHDPIAYGKGKQECIKKIIEEAEIHFAK